MQFKRTEGEGREGEIVDSGLLPSVQSICPDICIHELTTGLSDKHTCFFIVNLENLTTG